VKATYKFLYTKADWLRFNKLRTDKIGNSHNNIFNKRDGRKDYYMKFPCMPTVMPLREKNFIVL